MIVRLLIARIIAMHKCTQISEKKVELFFNVKNQTYFEIAK